jgi:hypothetical protein
MPSRAEISGFRQPSGRLGALRGTNDIHRSAAQRLEEEILEILIVLTSSD